MDAHGLPATVEILMVVQNHELALSMTLESVKPACSL
jgi:hypothetical protein